MKKQKRKHQNDRFIDEKLKTKSLMLFVSCDLQDFKFQYVNQKALGTQASCIELTLRVNMVSSAKPATFTIEISLMSAFF